MIRNFFNRLMYGRYGSDMFSLALVIGSLVLWILSAIIKVKVLSGIFWVLSYAALIFAIFRMFSRNYARRRQENEQFQALVGPLAEKFQRRRAQRRDKDHVYFHCPNCNQMLRVPKGKGTISVTCRNCGNIFQKKT